MAWHAIANADIQPPGSRYCRDVLEQ